eukprot:2403267-Amphidinium_carterae.1
MYSSIVDGRRIISKPAAKAKLPKTKGTQLLEEGRRLQHSDPAMTQTDRNVSYLVVELKLPGKIRLVMRGLATDVHP